MSDRPAKPESEIADIARHVPPPHHDVATAGFDVKNAEGFSERLVDAIDMIGEEKAAGLGSAGPSQVTPGMRYLHSSRTIHQLVTDRNRAVGIYLAVASLLLTASSGLFNASPKGDLIIPFTQIQRWCLPLTFATLAVLALLIAFLLIRTRVGLIYEVAKMNALLGLPVGRVTRVNVLSVFFILYAIIALAGGASSALFAAFMLALADPSLEQLAWPVPLIGVTITIGLLVLYVVAVIAVTSDKKLQQLEK